MKFDLVYYEPKALEYQLGKDLRAKYSDLEWIEINSHNSITDLQKASNKDFPRLKRHLVVGIRKTHKYVVNHKVSDYLVPYTSSGCTAMCLYCYLVCNYNKCSYLRLFVNREQMLDKIIKTSRSSERELTFEIGSNSDLVLENSVTSNLEWTIEEFAKCEKGFITLPTKFHYVDPLINLNHKGRTIIRMSVNPNEIISKVELGTSSLDRRIEAINKIGDAGYVIGLLIAPVVLIDDWQKSYNDLLNTLHDKLSDKVKSSMFIEIIFMTYSYIHRAINNEAFPNAVELYDKSIMGSRGYGKYCYKDEIRGRAEELLIDGIGIRFPKAKILYIV